MGIDCSNRSRLFARGHSIILLFVLMASVTNSQAEEPAEPCEPTANATSSISVAGLPATLVLKPSLSGNKTQATAQLFMKNDGVIPISKWCAEVYVVDLTGKGAQADIQIGEGPASRGEVCQDLPTRVEAGRIGEVPLSIFADQEQLPLTGIATIIATAKPEGKKCRIDTKAVSQNIVVTSMYSDLHAKMVFSRTALVSLVFFLFCSLRFRRWLPLKMGPSQWSFSSSTVTNLAGLGSLLGTALACSALPDYPHFITKQGYVVLSLQFAALAALSPILYSFFCRPKKPDPQNPQLLDFEGNVFLFLLSDSITIWAALGQMACLCLLLAEFTARRLVPGWSVFAVVVVAAGVAISLCYYCYRVARYYIQEHPSRLSPTGKRIALRDVDRTAAPRWFAL
jgi:hypothetical protein